MASLGMPGFRGVGVLGKGACKAELVQEPKAEVLRAATHMSGVIPCSPSGVLNNGPDRKSVV